MHIAAAKLLHYIYKGVVLGSREVILSPSEKVAQKKLFGPAKYHRLPRKKDTNA